MSEQEEEWNTEEGPEELLARADEILGTLGEAQRAIAGQKARYDAHFAKLREQQAAESAPWAEKRDGAMDELAKIAVHLEAIGALKGRSVHLRNGKLAIRDSKPTLVITDEKTLMRRLRQLRLLKLTTNIPARVIVKDKVKKLPSGLLAKLRPFAYLEVKTRVTATPAQTQAEISRDLNPLQRSIAESSPE